MAKKSMVARERNRKYKVRVRNRCQFVDPNSGKVCGRPRGYIRRFGLCRIHFRELALQVVDQSQSVHPEWFGEHQPAMHAAGRRRVSIPQRPRGARAGRQPQQVQLHIWQPHRHQGEPRLPLDLVTARRYRGKTNELFTQFLCNVARHASDFSEQPWTDLRVVDPLAGGGTTLLVALSLGADVAGVEKSPQDVESTAAFLRAYTREKGIPCKVQEERLRGVGRRWWFRVGRAPQGQCILALGETARAEDLLRGVRPPHLIVTDLPYGIQHHGPLVALLDDALPVWAGLLLPGGALAFSWDATRFSREEMLAIVGREGRLAVLHDPPYDALAHRVDRVIRRRDVLVARRGG